MTREMAFAMGVLDENEFACSYLPDLSVTRLVLDGAI